MAEEFQRPPGEVPRSAAERAGADRTPPENSAGSAHAGTPAGESGSAETVSGEVSALLQRQLDEANNRALRAQAELENYRKRARRELEDERRYASLPLVRDLLAVLDNLQLAIEAAEKHEGEAGLLEGVKMVSRQLMEVLRQHHCEEIPALHAPFDPHLHEAVVHQPSEEYPAGTVTRVTRSGYRLHDRVIRPSQVFVSRGAPSANSPRASEEGSADQ